MGDGSGNWHEKKDRGERKLRQEGAISEKGSENCLRSREVYVRGREECEGYWSRDGTTKESRTRVAEIQGNNEK